MEKTFSSTSFLRSHTCYNTLLILQIELIISLLPITSGPPEKRKEEAKNPEHTQKDEAKDAKFNI